MNVLATKNKEIVEKSGHVFVSNVRNTLKIANYKAFAKEFLKKKVLWDPNGTYTKNDRNAALASLAVALNVDMPKRVLLQFCMRYKKSHTKRMQALIQWCIAKKVPPELTIYRHGIPPWVKEAEAKLQALPRLIHEYRLSGIIPPEDKSQIVFTHFLYALAEESHNTQRLPTIDDVQKVAKVMGLKNYKLMHKLWNRQKDSALYKFRCLQQSGDVVKDIAFALTQLEWRVVDLVVLYVREFNIVFSLGPQSKISSFRNTYLLQPLLTLYHFVKTCNVEENDGVDEKEKWAKVVKQYSRKYVTSPSGFVLQRRWCELKIQVRDNILRRLRTQGYKVHPLVVEIAAKYPYIVKEPPQCWSDLVKEKKFCDVSNIQVEFSSDEEDCDDTGDNNEADKTTDADVDSDFDSEDERPLVIDEANTSRKKPSLPDLNWFEKDNKSNLNPTETQDPDEDTPPTLKKNLIQNINETNDKINLSSIEHKRSNEIITLNDELQSQLSNIAHDNSTSIHNTLTCTQPNPVINLTEYIHESEFEKLEHQLVQQMSYMKKLKHSSLSSDQMPPFEAWVKVNKRKTSIDKQSCNIKTDEKVHDSTSTLNREANNANLMPYITSTSEECIQGTSKSNSSNKINKDEKAKTKPSDNETIQTKTESVNAQEGFIATVYVCKASDGSDLGHLLIPGPINKESVKITLKSKDGVLAIDTCVVNDPKSPENASKESDLDLLQKIDPAQAETLIIYSDSEEEGENNKTSNEGNVLKAPEKDQINLNDVKKYLSNNSLDDILSKMDDLVVKQEVMKKENEVNRVCESYIYVSDSEGSDVEMSTVENNDSKVSNVTSKNEENDNIDIQDDYLDKGVDGILGGCSNEFTMSHPLLKKNVSNSIDARKTNPQDVFVTGDNSLNVPNANALIIPPNILIPAIDALAATHNVVSTNAIYQPPTVNERILPPNVVSTNGIYKPSTVNSPNMLISTPNIVNPTPNLQLLTPNIQIPTPNLLVPTRSIPYPTPDVLMPTVESLTSNVVIPTPNSNVVTMIINDKIGKKSTDSSNIIDLDDDSLLSNLGINVINKPSKEAPKKNAKKKTTNVPKPKRYRTTKTYADTAGYLGLFQLKERSTKETVGMLCRIKDESNLINEVTKKIDNYLEKFNDDPIGQKDKEKEQERQKDKVKEQDKEKEQGNKIKEYENENLLYDILSKKIEIEKKKDTASGSFLKMLLDNSQTKTLWTTEKKESSEEEEQTVSEQLTTIDPKLIMDTRIYLPKLDEIETYNKNRRVDFSINAKRISKVGYKILNYKRPSDPIPVVDADTGESAISVTDHVESEVSVVLKKKIPEKNSVTSRRRMSEEKLIVTPSTSASKRSYAVNLRTENLDNLTKRIKKERELQNIIQDKYKVTGVLNKIGSLTDKIRNERLKQQLINEKAPNIVQRIKFETDDSDFISNDEMPENNLLENDEENKITIEENRPKSPESNSFLQSVLQGTMQSTNDKIMKSTVKNKNENTNYDSEGSEDMELDTIDNNTLILDSSCIQNTNRSVINQTEEETTIANMSDHKEISTNNKITENSEIQNVPGISNVRMKSTNTILTDNRDVNMTVSVKVENVDENELSDDEELHVVTYRKVKKRIISSDDEDSKDCNKDSIVRKNSAADELSTQIENELLNDECEDITHGNDLLEEIEHYSSSDEEPVNNIEEMLKLCKPVKLCLDKVEVPKDTAQVRKVELPDWSSLKRHRAPTAHVAPINVRAMSETGEVATDNATEAEIGDLLQQLSMETAFEWQRLEETLVKNETIKPKRFKFHKEEPTSTKKESTKAEQSTERRSEKKSRRREGMKKKNRSPQKCNSDDEIDHSLEWQRQKNINYRFFNFHPISQEMHPDPSNNTAKKQQSKKFSKKEAILIKKMVVDADETNGMNEKQEIIDLQEVHRVKYDKKEVDNAVESIVNHTDNVTSIDDDKSETTVCVDSKTNCDNDLSKNLNLEDRVLIVNYLEDTDNEPLMPVFTTIDSGTEHSNSLKPIATKVELEDKESEKKVFSRPKKDDSTLTLKKIVPKPKFSIQSQNRYNLLPSTSQDVVKENSVTNQNKPSEEGEGDLICISDDSNDFFQSSDTISVKNCEINSKSDKLPTHLAVKKENLDLYKACHNSKNVRDNNNKNNTVQPKSVQTEILNINSEKSLRRNKSILDPPVKVMLSNIQIGSNVSKPNLKLMEIRPIGSKADKARSLLDNHSSNTEVNKVNDDGKSVHGFDPQITNFTSIQTTKGEDSVIGQSKEHSETIYPRVETVISVQPIDSVIKEQNKSNEKGAQHEVCPQIKNITSVPDSIDLDNDSRNDHQIFREPNIYDDDSDNLLIDENAHTDSNDEDITDPHACFIPIEKLHGNKRIETDLKNSKSLLSSEIDEHISLENKSTVSQNKGITSHKDFKSNLNVPINSKTESMTYQATISNQQKDKSSNDIGDSINKTNDNVSSMSESEKNTSISTNKSEKENTQKSLTIEDSNIVVTDVNIDENITRNTETDENRDKSLTDNEDNSRSSKKNITDFKILNIENSIVQIFHPQSESNVIMDIDVKNTNKHPENDSENNKEPKIYEEMDIESENIAVNPENCNENNSQSYTDAESKEHKNISQNLESTIMDTIDTVMKESENKPQGFLKLVPIQKLRGEPMPFQCTDSKTQSDDDDITGMPVISNVVSLSTEEVSSKQPSTIPPMVPLARPVQVSQAEIMQSRIWKPCVPDNPSTSTYQIGLDPKQLSSRPPVPIEEFIKHRDCTTISLLCIDEDRPLWYSAGVKNKQLVQKLIVVTNLRITPAIARPSYWTVGPRDACTRVLLNQTDSGSTTVGAVSVPDEVFIDNNWYKKLSSDPMIYAKIWFVVPHFKICKEMIQTNSNVQMHFYSLLTGAILPFNADTLSEKLEKTTYYKINAGNINSIQLPQLASLIQNSLQCKNPCKIIVGGHLEPANIFPKPVSSDEVISLDSDDE